jgi:hypothetical protein
VTRNTSGIVPWPVFVAFVAAELGVLLAVFGVTGSSLVQVPALVATTLAWLALQRRFESRALVPIPKLSVDRKHELKKAWTFAGVYFVASALPGLAAIGLGWILDFWGGVLFWFALPSVEGMAFWNSNSVRRRYVSFVWGMRHQPPSSSNARAHSAH